MIAWSAVADDIAVLGLDCQRETVILGECRQGLEGGTGVSPRLRCGVVGVPAPHVLRIARPAAEGDNADLQVSGDCAQVREPCQVGPSLCRVRVGGVEGAGDRGKCDTGLVGGRPNGVHDVIRYGLVRDGGQPGYGQIELSGGDARIGDGL